MDVALICTAEYFAVKNNYTKLRVISQAENKMHVAFMRKRRYIENIICHLHTPSLE
jgi:hypothetical protein